MKSNNTSNILLIDDNINLLTLLKNLLIENNYNPMAFVNRLDAADYIQYHLTDLDLIITDIDTSSSEIDTVSLIKNYSAHIPILVLTGSVNIEILESIASLGIEIVRKPFIGATLLQKIREKINQ